MKTVIFRSILYSAVAVAAAYATRVNLGTDNFLSDVSGLSTFVSAFGALYGVMAAFIVFEVWNQYGKIVDLLDQESLGLERLYRLTLYFKNKTISIEMKKAIKTYADIIIEDRFKTFAEGRRHVQSSKPFRRISKVIRDITFQSEHDEVVFQNLIDNYGKVSMVRNQRINQSLTRLPNLLTIYLFAASLIAVVSFVIMPFANVYYGFFAAGAITFVVTMIYQLVKGLNNPFRGAWKIKPEPFERVMRHIEEDYS
jgi:hypothetical protein